MLCKISAYWPVNDQNGQKKCSLLSNGNSGFLYDLFFLEVSELNGIVWMIIGSVCQFDSCWCAFNIQNGCCWFMNWDNYFVFNPKNLKIKNLCWCLRCFGLYLDFGNALHEFCCFAGSMMGSDRLLFFCDFFWRPGLLEYWIRLNVLGHCFGCSLLPGNSSLTLLI